MFPINHLIISEYEYIFTLQAECKSQTNDGGSDRETVQKVNLRSEVIEQTPAWDRKQDEVEV